ncbi:SMEK domain-containing protein [Paenibacillus sp. OT2-17]|uniref:SMEK domain-containing protein n=1 Tax=Paenibacillus sp. OT2-17 TaxID=2691605 RepID=UPI001352DBED|nr:SMEK domain-containing protein [Paenibacillus sp. OT2-17]MXO78610.1 SMEK domain-containing protein [Paenibacillus sp. OT2-17]
MNKEIYLKLISSALAKMVYEVELRNCISLFDINIIAEDFYKEFLKIIYGYNLINLNILEKNTSAIDLADQVSRIAIQVTSDNSSTKINETIKKFNEKKLHAQYDRLIFLMLIKKKNYTTSFDTEGLFSFSKDTDIIDHLDLIQHIKNKDTLELMLISEFLNQELMLKVGQTTRKQSNEVETIIALIEYLSSNKKVTTKKVDTITDPEDKINRRFKDYSDFLKGLYIELVSLYGEAVKQANEILGLDDVKSLLIRLYLRDISNKYLEQTNGNPREALELLALYFEEQLGASGFEFDKMAIKYYLISETIKCNVFPNIVGEKVGTS